MYPDFGRRPGAAVVVLGDNISYKSSSANGATVAEMRKREWESIAKCRTGLWFSLSPERWINKEEIIKKYTNTTFVENKKQRN